MMRYLVIIVLMFSSICYAQNASADFAKINNAYGNSSKLSMKVKYNVYKNKDINTVLQTELGEIMVDGRSKFTKVGKIESLENDDYTLVVDNEEKLIVLLGKKTDYHEEKLSTEVLMVKLDTILKLSSKLEYKKDNDEQSTYLLAFANGEYSEMKITFNNNTFFIDKMVMYYKVEENFEDDKGEKERPRMEIYFSDINTNPVFSKSTFTYEKYLEKLNGNWQCKPAYKAYTLKQQMFN